MEQSGRGRSDPCWDRCVDRGWKRNRNRNRAGLVVKELERREKEMKEGGLCVAVVHLTVAVVAATWHGYDDRDLA